ncbi:hypothetical protein JAO76_01235 [Pontibacter sp. BT310]|uniref:Uncharacterized protein n=1 Tax=Pontibacter populi TaxID=890055 RepID=A0ABS6X6Y6_9BACT|nr:MULTISPECIES: hypothetical protein [Pontibacter]MBJ6116794.1 hypothetical protein [Pontibacter sp. BT310]MBR0569216.1 hypothetical protein [Microvirga sp. STS03]MBW3363647.1 hypothetical protein [Pontibacter populi]
MNILHWKQKDWSGREFALRTTDQPLGNITFTGWSGYDAVYTSGTATISFTNKGWFDQEVTITYNGEEIGKATASLFGKTKVLFNSGETYLLKSKPFSYNREVQDESGETLISFKQPAFSFGKGDIIVSEELPDLTREVLVSTSLYLKSVAEHQAAILIIIFIPIFVRNVFGS